MTLVKNIRASRRFVNLNLNLNLTKAAVLAAAALLMVSFMGTQLFAADVRGASIETQTTALPQAPGANEARSRHGMSDRARRIFEQLAAENPGIESRSVPRESGLVYSAKRQRVAVPVPVTR